MGSNHSDKNFNNDDFDIDENRLEDYVEDDSISVISLMGNQKFLDWVKQTHKKVGMPLEKTDDEVLNDIESFHVPSFTDEEDMKDFFMEYGEEIFHYMFALYFRDKSLFPPFEGLSSLDEWFEISVDECIRSFEEVLDYLEEIDGKVK